MSKQQITERRVLIVDDQQEIHETFRRVFAHSARTQDDLADFESRFLNDDSQQEATPDEKPAYRLTHAHGGEEGVQCVRESVENSEQFSVAFDRANAQPAGHAVKRIIPGHRQ